MYNRYRKIGQHFSRQRNLDKDRRVFANPGLGKVSLGTIYYNDISIQCIT